MKRMLVSLIAAAVSLAMTATALFAWWEIGGGVGTGAADLPVEGREIVPVSTDYFLAEPQTAGGYLPGSAASALPLFTLTASRSVIVRLTFRFVAGVAAVAALRAEILAACPEFVRADVVRDETTGVPAVSLANAALSNIASFAALSMDSASGVLTPGPTATFFSGGFATAEKARSLELELPVRAADGDGNRAVYFLIGYYTEAIGRVYSLLLGQGVVSDQAEYAFRSDLRIRLERRT